MVLEYFKRKDFATTEELDKAVNAIIENPDSLDYTSFSDSYVRKLLEEVKEILIDVPTLVQLPKNGIALFVGDTHGDFEATKTVFRYFKKRYNNDHNTHLIFLGDFIDRGEETVRNINLLLIMKYKYPKNVHLIKGNHEAYKEIPFSPYEFKSFYSPHEAGYDTLDASSYYPVFDQLPLCLLTDNGVFASHGGIEMPPLLHHLNIDSITSISRDELIDRINEKSMGYYKYKTDLYALYSFCWGDIDPGRMSGGKVNETGGFNFDKKEFDNFMNAIGGSVMIRAHQPDHVGAPEFNDHILTIMTSEYYDDFDHIGRWLVKVHLEKDIDSFSSKYVERITIDDLSKKVD